MLDFLNARTDIRRKAGEIYGAIVTQARRPAFYADARCPRYTVGTLRDGGRSPFSGARAAAERLPTRIADLPRLLVEAFIADMDDSLREMGTGDLTVPKKVRRAATGLYERSMAYKAALAAERRRRP